MAGSLINDKGKLDVKNYNKKVDKQREVFNRIDSTMAILEKLPDFVDSTLDIINANSFTFSASPLGFLFNILKSLGVDEATLREWIVEILVYTLPAVETGVKASLLSNIKALVSCNTDPRIPLRLRKKVSESVYTNILTGGENERGIDINIDAIDPEGILDLSPFTNPGKLYYFGCGNDKDLDDSIKNVVSKYDDSILLDEVKVVGNGNARTAKLVRADDFNAFLWYVVHKGNKQNPIGITISDDGTFSINNIIYRINGGGTSLLGEVTVEPTNGESNIIAGTTLFEYNNPNNIAICIKSNVDNEGNVISNTLVPVSSDWFSCNWYVDKTNYYSSNLGYKRKTNRNYSEEKAICNLRYYTQADYNANIAPHNFRFTILPKPYVLLPSVDAEKDTRKIHVQWRPIKLLFDAEGNPDQKGKFSLISETYDLQPTLINKRTDGENTVYDVNGIKNGGVHTICTTLTVNTKTGKYYIDTYNPDFKSALVECYPGLTVYEFNYDYIMGMKLFDPKVVCQRIFDNAANPYYDADFKFTLNKLKNKKKYPYIAGKQRIVQIVREILEEDEDEIMDCFYTFSNEQFDEMLRKTEEIRYRQLPYNQGYNEGISIDFTEVNKILEAFPENGTDEEKREVINKALIAACDRIGNKDNTTLPTDNSTAKIDFLTNLLQQLVAAIVDALLSPKLLMLLLINNELMNGTDEEPLSAEDLMKLLKSVIKSLIREVRDLIIKKLLDYILEYLTPLALQIQAKVMSEQFAAYMSIIRLLLSWFNKGVETVGRLSSILSSIASRFGNDYDFSNMTDTDLVTILDDVFYADIYSTDIKDKEPINNNC